jgi:type VI secretion system secreted protein VgrG
MYGAFSYDGMAPGVQWTAIWLRESQLVHFETKPWDGTTGGYGFTDWNPPAHEWLPGIYQVQIFAGLDWKVVGEFTVEGPAATASPTLTRTPTTRPTATRTPSPTPTVPTSTRRPSQTSTP